MPGFADYCNTGKYTGSIALCCANKGEHTQQRRDYVSKRIGICPALRFGHDMTRRPSIRAMSRKKTQARLQFLAQQRLQVGLVVGEHGAGKSLQLDRFRRPDASCGQSGVDWLND